MAATKSTRKIEYGDVVKLRWGYVTVGIVRNNPYDDKAIVLEIHPLFEYGPDGLSSLDRPRAPYTRSFGSFDPIKDRDRILGVYKTPEEVYQMLTDRFQKALKGIQVSTNVAEIKM